MISHFYRYFIAIFLQISDNGYVTLNTPMLSTFPQPFPIKSGAYRLRISTMIAPYWSDVDTRCRGPHDQGRRHVYYRQLRVFPGSDLYNKIQKEVSNVNVTDTIFKPTSVLIVTWNRVKSSDCYDAVCSGLILLNNS